MTNRDIAKLLREVAASYLLNGENRFKIVAYDRAADTIEGTAVDIQDLWKEGKLTTLPGVGSSISSYLSELFEKGSVKHFNFIKASMPACMFVLMDIPTFGPKKAFRLSKELKLDNPKTAIADLQKAIAHGKVATLEGFGEKSQQDISEAIERFQKGQFKENRVTLPIASAIAGEVRKYLLEHKDVLQAIPLGSLRRQLSTIGDIDFAVSTKNPEAVLDWFVKFPKKQDVIERGPTGASLILTNGRQVDVRVQQPQLFGAMLQYFTGSKQHNIRLRELGLKKGYSLNEYGIKPIKDVPIQKKFHFNKKKNLYEFATEEELYSFLGLQLVPPELREDRGEVEKAMTHSLPHLLELADMKGDLHIHTSYDLKPSHDLGSSDLKTILLEGEKLGYEYVGINDHNPKTSGQSKEQINAIMKKRKLDYEHIYSSTKSVRVKLLIMLEIDIQPDGSLALPDSAFEYIDGSIVSIHSVFTMNKDEMTKRVLKGLSHPKARILAHPTGRLLTKRDGYDLDWGKIFSFCKEKNKALEINSYPERLDLPDDIVMSAIRNGVKLVIDTDSHDVSHMDLMKYGVSVARRGWAKKSDILNTMQYNEFKEWLTQSI